MNSTHTWWVNRGSPPVNVRPELLAVTVGVGIAIGSGELSPESSIHGLDQGEVFAFGNDGSD